MKNLQWKVIDFYFMNLSIAERKSFLEVFVDIIVKDEIKKIESYFFQYPFYNEVLIKETKGIYELKDIVNWQRCYYASIYKEYHSSSSKNINSETINLYSILKEKNSSFKYLIDLGDAFNQEDKGLFDIETEGNSSSSLIKDLFTIHSIQNSEKASKLKKSDKPSTLDSSFVEDEKDDNDFINKLISKLKY